MHSTADLPQPRALASGEKSGEQPREGALFRVPHGAYFITFTCYGTHPAGSVVRTMKNDPYILDAHRCVIALAAIREVCQVCEWPLLAVHVRATHVHIVVEADQRPEPVMTKFKAYVSRALNRIEPPRRRWTRHGSTRYLWTPEEITAAVHYVISRQGEPMASFAALR